MPRDLPNPPVYSKTNPADAPILVLSLTSATLALPQIQSLADTRLVPKISQLPGVGLVSISGGQKPAVRIRANPTALASYGLSFSDVQSAVGAANANQAKGTFDGPQRAYTIDANDAHRERRLQFVIGAYKRRRDTAVGLRRSWTTSKREAGRLERTTPR